jgi:hypothetical protein
MSRAYRPTPPVKTPPKQAPKKTGVGMVLWVFLMLGVMGVVGGIVWYINKPKEQQIQTVDQGNGPTVLIDQALVYESAFKRMTSAGFSPYAVTYGGGGEADMLSRFDIVKPQEPPEGLLDEGVKAKWQLGGGQLVDAFDAERPDVAFFLNGLTESACRHLNHILWSDNADASPQATGVSLAEWRNKSANILEVFQGNSRSEGCVRSREGEFIYYHMVERSPN